MGQCSRLNCTAREHVVATSDIAGNGVLYAFLASALLTVAAIAYAYVSDSLPETYLNDVDNTVILALQSFLPSRKRMHKIWMKVKTIFLLGRTPASPTRRLSRRERQEAVTRFILTLSDQQLATGLAILISSLSNQCTLTVYEFELAFSLAWFSSTTHLATLDVLREYFNHHGVVRNWRVFGMIVLLCLLLYSLVMSVGSVDSTLPVQCTYRYFGRNGYNSHDPLDVYLIIASILVPLILVWSYAVRIYWCYRRLDGKPSTLERIIFKMKSRQPRKVYKPDKHEIEALTNEAVLEQRAFVRRNHLERIHASKGFLRQYNITIRGSKAYSQSFLSLGPLVIFMVSFGFTQLYVVRWDPDVPVTVDESMNFGQIMPLFLLVIPIFAAAEIYYEVKGGGYVGTSDHETRSEPSNHNHVLPSQAWVYGRHSITSSQYLNDRELAQLLKSSELYNEELPLISRFFYFETKSIHDRLGSTMTFEEHKTVLHSQAGLLSKFYTLQNIEKSLAPTLLRSGIEFLLCSAASLAFGILINVDNPREPSTIVSLVILVLYIVYTGSGFIFDLKDAWVPVSNKEYERLLKEVRARKGRETLTAVSSYATAMSLPTAEPDAERKKKPAENQAKEKN